MQKWSVIKEEHIKWSQEFMYPFVFALDDEWKIITKKIY